MKYWILTTEYPPFFGGGISTYCFFTAKMLAAKGHEVSVFVNDSSVENLEICYQPNLRVIRFNPVQTNSFSFLGHVTNISYEFAFIVKTFIEKEGKPDLIEAQEYLGIAYYLLQFKHLDYKWCREIPVLITTHSPSFLYLEYNNVPLFKYPNFWIGEMERFCINAADLVISPSKYLISEVEARFSINQPNLFILPNPFEISEKYAESEGKVKPEQIVFLGKLSPQKGTFKLVSYFKNLWESGLEEPLYLIGGQDIVYHPEGKTMGDIIRKRYKSFIASGLLNLEDRIKPSEIKARLANAKVVIIPSTVDNLPYVVMEMMSLGLIVLVSKQGGQAEIVQDGINGYIFDHNEPETFNTQLSKILALTDKERNIIGENAISRIKSAYNPDLIYAEKLKIIDSYFNQKTKKNTFPFIRQVDLKVSITRPLNPVIDTLSIVIPYYNLGKYLEETIKSIKAADFKEKEIIIVNDGSTDPNSITKLEAYVNDPEVTIINSKNQGLAAARNFGAAAAKGTYLAFLDADDLVAPDYFSKAINVLRNSANVHFVGCWTRYFEGSDKIWPTFVPEPPIILFHNLVNSSALVYKKDSFLAGGKNDDNMPFPGLEDYESVVALVSNGLNGVVLPEVLFYYRVRKNSMIRGVSKTKKLILLDYIANKHFASYAKYGNQVFSLANSNGSGIILDNPSLDYHLTDKLPFNSNLSKKIIYIIKKNKYAKHLAYRAYRLINK